MFNNFGYNGPFNPMAPIQQRLGQYEQTYPQYAQNGQASIPQRTQYIKCQPVTSIDEARAAMIDLDGSVTVFVDFANDKIYTKQINLDGTAGLKQYEQKQETQENTLEKRVKDLEEIVRGLRGGAGENDKSNANGADDGANKKRGKSHANDGSNDGE